MKRDYIVIAAVGLLAVLSLSVAASTITFSVNDPGENNTDIDVFRNIQNKENLSNENKAPEINYGGGSKGQNPGEVNPTGPGGSKQGSGTRVLDPNNPLVIFAALAVLGFVGVSLIVLSRSRRGGEEIEFETVEDVDEEDEDVEKVAEAARRAADSISEDADIENAVYRAWHEMTRYLNVDKPTSSTPGEFAEAAVEAGMDEEDIDELTRLFEEVRYGDALPTEEREKHALRVLRNIENRYAEDGSSTSDFDTSGSETTNGDGYGTEEGRK